MNRLLKNAAAILLSMTAANVFAAPPRLLITHNTTDVESNAYIAGTIPSRHPTKAHSDSRVSWSEVRIACFGHLINGQCPAMVKMATGPNDGEAVDIGIVSVDLNTGMITPSTISGNGYTLIVNAPGETTLIKN